MRKNLIHKIGTILLPSLAALSYCALSLGLGQEPVKEDSEILELVKYVKKNGIKIFKENTNTCKGKLHKFASWTIFGKSQKLRITYNDFGNGCNSYNLSDYKIWKKDELHIIFNSSTYDKKHLETYFDISLDGIPEQVQYIDGEIAFSYDGNAPGTFKEENAKAYYRQMLGRINVLSKKKGLSKTKGR